MTGLHSCWIPDQAGKTGRGLSAFDRDPEVGAARRSEARTLTPTNDDEEAYDRS